MWSVIIFSVVVGTCCTLGKAFIDLNIRDIEEAEQERKNAFLERGGFRG